jgi:uncharacterized protein (DUF885 family)
LLGGLLCSGAMNMPAQEVKFERFTGEFTRQMLALSPVSATSAGYHVHTDPRTGRALQLDELLDDFSPAGLAHRRATLARLEQELDRFSPDKLDGQEQIDLRIMRQAIDETRFELDRVQGYRHDPNAYATRLGFAIFEPMVQEYAPLPVRLRHLFARLEKVPAFLNQARENLADTAPVYTNAAVEGIGGDISLLNSQLKQLVEQINDTSLRERYQALRPATVAALEQFRRYLTEDLARHATGTWRLGPELYAEKMRLVLGTDMPPNELRTRALRAMADTRAAMYATALPLHRELFPAHGEHGDLAPQERENRVIRKVLEKIAADQPGRDQLLTTARRDLDELRRFIREKNLLTLPAGKNLQVIETPPFVRSAYGVGGLAPAPPLEPSLGAFFWVTPIPPDWPADRVASKLREYNNYTLQILAMHEALPGHYVQFEDANRLRPESRRALRAVFANGPYVEGWAMYSETVVLDAGYLDNNPRLKLMHQKWQLRAISNAALDVRMHTQNMTDAEALDMMERETFQEAAEAEAKLIRAKLSSAQLPTYFLGLAGWQDLRRAVEKTRGAKFNLRQFHDQALAVGPIPLPEVRRLMLSPAPPAAPRKRAS